MAEEYARINQLNIEQIQNQTALLGKSREENEVSKARTELLKRESDEIRKLQEQRSRLTEDQQAAGLGGVIDAQIAKIKEQTQADIESTETAIRNNQEKLRSDSLRLFSIQNQVTVERDLRKIQDDINKSTLSEMQRRQYDILAAARERAATEIAAEQTRRGSLLTDQEKLKFYDEAYKGTQELIAAEEEMFAKSRQFSTGWKQAFNEFVDSATNAAEQGRRIFQNLTQGMEDLLFKFVKTGRFEFNNFVQGMVDTLLRSQIQQLMANVLGGGLGAPAGGGGGRGGLLGGALIPGFLAKGGPANANRPYIVGERGPELFVPNTTGTVVPNGQFGGGSGGTVTYNINAVDAMSFKQMLAKDPSFLYAVTEQGRRTLPGAA